MAGRSLHLCVLLTLSVSAVRAYYLPGTYPQEFKYGQTLAVEVNSLVSSETDLPFDYYTMPFCAPEEGVKKSAATINPGTILSGTRIENSPYKFHTMVTEKTKVVCHGEGQEGYYGPLTKLEYKNLKEKIGQEYRVRLILDNLPVTTYALEQDPESVRPGFELGFVEGDNAYINNHLMFKVLVHPTHGEYTKMREDMKQLEAATVEGGRKLLQEDEEYTTISDPMVEGEPEVYMVVGFEVVACSIKRTPGQPLQDIPCPNPEDANPPEPQKVTEGAEIVYTYDVYWEKSDVQWASRWDSYLKMPGGKVHWFSILNSLMVVVVMSCIVAMIMMRTIRRDLQRYEQLLVDSGPNADMEESGWKMVSGDVFRTPKGALSLCMQLGSGVQIVLAGFITLVFAALGFLSPASRGALLTSLLVMYLVLAAAGGFSAVYLWGLMNRSYDGWQKVCLRVACFFPGGTLLLLTVLNLFIHHTGSSGAIPLGAFFSLIALWFIVSTPLCYAGGAMAIRQEIKTYPTRTNQIPRHIPPAHWLSHPLVLFLASGLLPFGTLFVELYFAMTSMWQGFYYYLFGFLLLVQVLTVVITVEVSIVCTYVQLCAEDYLWWWRSFHRGGAVAVYVLVYSLGFLVNTLHNLAGGLSVLLYCTYMGLLMWVIFLALGTCGFLASFLFTYKIFESVKAD